MTGHSDRAVFDKLDVARQTVCN